MSGQEQVKKYTRARNRKRMLDVDLNAMPPSDNRDQEGPSYHTRSQERQTTQGGGTNIILPPTIDVEAIDDDVVISSPRAFAQAKDNSRRNCAPPVVVDVETEERLSRNKRRRAPSNQAVINCDYYINLEGSSNSQKKSGQGVATAPLPPAPPIEPTFSCPVCMGTLVEETSTKCGHIFCKGCIKAAIAVQAKCPTCRKRTTLKDLIRIYLPATRTT